VPLAAKQLTNKAPRVKEKIAKPKSRLEILLSLEGEALGVQDRRQLRHTAVNNARKLVPYGHGIFFVRNSAMRARGGPWIIKSISSHGVVDRTSPFIRWFEKSTLHAIGEDGGAKLHGFDLSTQISDDAEQSITYPFRQALWIPLGPDAALLFSRETPWDEASTRLLARLCAAYGCVWKALGVKTAPNKPSLNRRRLWRLLMGVMAICGLWPVQMTTLAPAEVVAAAPQIISAPMNGVIAKIHAPPNSAIKKGDVIASYIDTSARNEFTLMSEEVLVAQARLKKTMLASFKDPELRRDLKILEAELALAKSRQAYASENLAMTTIEAEHDGLLLYTDENDWAGRPVTTGERIATIANPAAVELLIEAPTGDARLLQKNAKTRLFLDADPLNAITAALAHSNYYAEPMPDGNLAYLTTANFSEGATPRIGARGVAKIYGAKAPLMFWLLRKPIVAVRQFFGL